MSLLDRTVLAGFVVSILVWPQVRTAALRGQLVETDGKPVGNANIRLVSFVESATTPAGDFVLNIPQVLQPGDHITLAVEGWEVKDPYQGVPGGMFLPRQLNNPLRVVVVRMVQAALDHDLIQSILEQYGSSLISLRDDPDGPIQTIFPQFLAAQAPRFQLDARQMQGALDDWAKQPSTDAYGKGLYALAMNHFTSAVDLIQKSEKPPTAAFAALGLAEFRLEHYKNAETQLAKALERQPLDPIVLNNLGATKFKLKLPEQAKSLFSDALAIARRTKRSRQATLINANLTALSSAQF